MASTERKIGKPRAYIHKDVSAQDDLDFLKKMPSEFWTGAVKDEWVPEEFSKAYNGPTMSKIDPEAERLIESKKGCLLFSKGMEAVYIDAIATMIEKQDPKYLRFKESMKKIKQDLSDPEHGLLHLYRLYDSNCNKPEFTPLDCKIMLLTISYYEVYESMLLGEIPSWDTIVKTKYRNLRDKDLAQYLKRWRSKLINSFTTANWRKRTRPAFFPCVVLLNQACKATSSLLWDMQLSQKEPAVHFRFLDGSIVHVEGLKYGNIDRYADFETLREHDDNEHHFAEISARIVAKFQKAGIDTAALEKLSKVYEQSDWYHYAFEQKEAQSYQLKNKVADSGPNKSLREPEKAQQGDDQNQEKEQQDELQKQEQAQQDQSQKQEQAQQDNDQKKEQAQQDKQDVDSVKIVAEVLEDGTPLDAEDVTKVAQAIEKAQSEVEPLQVKHNPHDPVKLKAMITPDGTYGNDHMWYLEQRTQNLDAGWEKLLKLVKVQYRSCLCIEILANQVRERRGIPNIRIRINSTLENSLRQIKELLRAMKPAPKERLGEVEEDQKSECTSAEYDRADGFIKSCQLQQPIMFGSPAGHEKDVSKTPIEQLILQAKMKQRRPLNFGWLNRLGMEADQKTTLVRFGVALSYYLDFADVVEIQNQLNDELRSALQADPELAVDAVLIQKIVAPDLGGLFK